MIPPFFKTTAYIVTCVILMERFLNFEDIYLLKILEDKLYKLLIII